MTLAMVRVSMSVADLGVTVAIAFAAGAAAAAVVRWWWRR